MRIQGFVDIVPLGQGGVGDVYRAVRQSTGSTVAIKVLRDWSDRDVAWQRAQRELHALVGLRGHPNVVHVEEIVESEGVLAIVMEYTPGGSVHDLMRARDGTLPLPEAVLIGEQVCAALASSHERGIVHRDIKPHNLLIGSFGQVKVCDFGISALSRSDAVSERTSALSYRYASPEELRGDAEVTSAADMYSLAATLHQVVTGQHLAVFGGPQPEVLSVWQVPPDLPPEVVVGFRELIQACASPEASDRPTALAALHRFEELGRDLGTSRCRVLEGVPPDDSTIPRPAPVEPTIPRAAPVDPTIPPVPPPVVQPEAAPTIPQGQHPAAPAAGGPYAVPPPVGAHAGGTFTAPPGSGPIGVQGVGAEPPRRNLGVVVTLVAAVVALTAAVAVLLLVRGNTVSSPDRAGSETALGADADADDPVVDQAGPTATAQAVATTAAATTTTTTTTSTTTTSTTTTTTTTSTTTTVPLTPEQAAAREIRTLIDGDRSTLQALFGRWVPQLSAKQYDWVEPDSGVRFFWEQILADHQQFRDQPHGSLLIAPFEFSSSSAPWYFTVVDAPQSSKDRVKAWCNSNGYVYGSTCVAREIDMTS